MIQFPLLLYFFLYLIYFDKNNVGGNDFKIPGVDLRNMPLSEIIESVERHLIVDAIRNSDKLEDAAGKLKLSKQALSSKIKKFNINHDNK